MSRPHPVLVDLAAGRAPRAVAAAEGQALVRSAVEHRVDGLLHSAVADGTLAVGADEARELARLDVLRRLQVRRARASLVEATTRLRDAGFAAATFKGVTAGDRWYSRPGERAAGDVDLWLAPHHAGDLRDAVAALEPSHPFVTAQRDRAVRAINVDVGGVWVDLHRAAVLPRLPAAFDRAVWEGTILAAVDDGAAVRVPSPPAALVQLLVHLNKHHFRDLVWFADVARLLAVDAPTDRETLALARLGGLDVVARRSLALVRSTLGLPSPVDAARGWRDRLWDAAWPATVALRGPEIDEEGSARQRLTMPLVVRGRPAGTALALADVVFPAAHLVELEYGAAGGSYLRRLATGRTRRWRARRRGR